MTVEQWAAGVGFVLPMLVAIINRSEWKPWVKAIVALLSSIAAGTVTALLAGEFTGANWLQAIGVVFASSQLAYHTWWKNSSMTSWLEETINVITGRKTSESSGEADGAIPRSS